MGVHSSKQNAVLWGFRGGGSAFGALLLEMSTVCMSAFVCDSKSVSIHKVHITESRLMYYHTSVSLVVR